MWADDRKTYYKNSDPNEIDQEDTINPSKVKGFIVAARFLRVVQDAPYQEAGENEEQIDSAPCEPEREKGIGLPDAGAYLVVEDSAPQSWIIPVGTDSRIDIERTIARRALPLQCAPRQRPGAMLARRCPPRCG